MSIIKISELIELPELDSDLSNTQTVIVDVPSKTTMKVTAKTLSNSIYTDTVTRLSIVNIRDYGAVGDGNSDDTGAIQAAINYVNGLGGGTVFIPSGVYRCRNVELKSKVHLIGEGRYSSKLRFMRSGNISQDATSYVINWTGSLSSIEKLQINGQNPSSGSNGNSICNGIFITPDSGGYHRKLIDCEVIWFAGYNPTPTGGTYGINQNYSASDIATNYNHNLIGGNAVLVDDYPYGNELVIERCSIGYCDGYGLNMGSANDSRVVNTYIGAAVRAGLVVETANKNMHITNVKVYLCRQLTPRSFVDTIPYTLGNTDVGGAIVLTGAGHQISNLEAQQNGSHGFIFGTSGSIYGQKTHGLNLSNISIISDGNGGYDSTANSTTNLSYQRYGVMCINYYGLNVNLNATDFRAYQGIQRQSRSIHTLGSRPTFNSNSDLFPAEFYTITSNTGSDFTPLQYGYDISLQSNSIDWTFQAQGNTGILSTATFGTGILSAPNGYSNFIIQQHNQAEYLSGSGLGYYIGQDHGTSSFVINGEKIAKTRTSSDVAIAVSLNTQTQDNFQIRGNGDMRWGDGANTQDAFFTRVSSGVLGTLTNTSLRAGGGAWNGGHLIMGNYHIWIDDLGKLRMKSSTPSSNADGTIIGTQS